MDAKLRRSLRRRAYEKAASGVCVRRGARRGAAPVSRSPMSAQQAGGAIPIDNDDLGGTVTGPKGPEAGVWVIAETTDLPTKFAKIVVTDDRGRYLIPGSAEGQLQRVGARLRAGRFAEDADRAPGRTLNLTAVPAPNPRAAAEYYPAGYWFSLMKVPDKSEFPGTGDTGNGISPTMQTQAQWIRAAQVRRLHRMPRRSAPRGCARFRKSSAPSRRRLRRGIGACSRDRRAAR